MKNTQEVEKRIILTPAQREHIFEDLLAMGAADEGVEELEDSYFCRKEYKSFEQTAMKDVGSYGLRVRKKTNGGKIQQQLNIKVITEEDNHHSWEEHETNIEDADEMKEILSAIGQKEFFTFKKTRHIFKIDGLEVLIEDIEGFGPIIEVEAKTTFDQSEKMQQKIVSLLKNLHLDPEKIVPKSVTYILMQEKSKF